MIISTVLVGYEYLQRIDVKLLRNMKNKNEKMSEPNAPLISSQPSEMADPVIQGEGYFVVPN